MSQTKPTVFQTDNPVEIHGIKAISVSLNSAFIIQNSSPAEGAYLEGLGYGK